MASGLGIEGLTAYGPPRRFANRLKLFGQFVGDWDIVSVRGPSPKGVRFKSGGEVHFGWVLGGWAVQDVWMTYDTRTRKAVPVGTASRGGGPRMSAWRGAWSSVVGRAVGTRLARKAG